MSIDNKTRLYGLVIECPYIHECKDCPIKEIREMKNLEKQIEIIDNMTVEQINELILWHKKRRIQRSDISELK